MATKIEPKPDLDETTFIFLLLSGFIREIGVNQLYPDDIIRMCKRYSVGGWRQNLCNSGLKVTNFEVVTTTDGYNGYYKNAFGSLIAKSPGKYIWKVRVNKMNEHLSMFTGIVGIKAVDDIKIRSISDMSFLGDWRGVGHGYGYKCAFEWGSWSWQRQKNRTVRFADVLEVNLDFNKSEPQLTISNGKEQLLQKDVPNLEYRLAFGIFYEDDTVEIVDFMYYR